jgi:tripartite ATP-independent transporter DctM subunit
MAMGTMALPAMLARGYEKRMAAGTILAGGALGQLIPPSILALVFSSIANISVGKMFLAGVLPGIMLSGRFIVYIGVRSFLNKELCPPLSQEALAQISWYDRWIALLKNVPALLIIVAVLGSLFAGLASPTESAAVGAAASLLLAAGKGRINRQTFWLILTDSVKGGAMVMWIATSSLLFVAVYSGVGGAKFVNAMLLGLDLPSGVIMGIMLLIVFILGFFMDPTGILYLTGPIFVPIVIELGYSPIWFGGMLIVNLETSYLTPPFGYNLFYLKSVAGHLVTTKDLYLAVPPFILVQLGALLLCAIFPELITWLPTALLGQ